MPDFSRRTFMATVVVVAGVVAILVALLSSSSSPNSDDPRQSSNESAVEPVPPLNPEDIDPRPAATEKPVNPTDPYAVSFGKSARRDVTVKVTANGAVNMSLSYRDKRKPTERVVNGAFSATRTFKGRFPMASVVVQIPGNIPGTASRATCSITIDGVEVVSRTATKAGHLTICVG